jgi:HAD superfamily hydrolase (TIGR01450 family)
VALADRYDCVLFDIDGVLMRGDTAIHGAAAALDFLRRRGKGRAFMTNNSGRTPEQVAARLTGVGLDVDAASVATSALTTADVLGRDGVRNAFVIGERGLRDALADRDIDVLDGDPDRVDVVVVGWDRTMDYQKLRRACLLVERGARLVATNADASFPAEDGRWPGAGALLAAVTVTTGARPQVVGKPHGDLFRIALDRAGGGRPLVVGDRLDTDIEGAHDLGWDSLLVLTGVSSEADAARSTRRPTYVAADVSALADDVARFEPVGRP